mmetsp:Transcript_56773/g.179498  ORF Transcript_56773/g.179498 Transcript_56773/m.179498 type:complete len:926 (+) Transcript_56773:1415-4192(+)
MRDHVLALDKLRHRPVGVLEERGGGVGVVLILIILSDVVDDLLDRSAPVEHAARGVAELPEYQNRTARVARDVFDGLHGIGERSPVDLRRRGLRVVAPPPLPGWVQEMELASLRHGMHARQPDVGRDHEVADVAPHHAAGHGDLYSQASRLGGGHLLGDEEGVLLRLLLEVLTPRRAVVIVHHSKPLEDLLHALGDDDPIAAEGGLGFEHLLGQEVGLQAELLVHGAKVAEEGLELHVRGDAHGVDGERAGAHRRLDDIVDAAAALAVDVVAHGQLVLAPFFVGVLVLFGEVVLPLAARGVVALADVDAGALDHLYDHDLRFELFTLSVLDHDHPRVGAHGHPLDLVAHEPPVDGLGDAHGIVHSKADHTRGVNIGELADLVTGPAQADVVVLRDGAVGHTPYLDESLERVDEAGAELRYHGEVCYLKGRGVVQLKDLEEEDYCARDLPNRALDWGRPPRVRVGGPQLVGDPVNAILDELNGVDHLELLLFLGIRHGLPVRDGVKVLVAHPLDIPVSHLLAGVVEPAVVLRVKVDHLALLSVRLPHGGLEVFLRVHAVHLQLHLRLPLALKLDRVVQLEALEIFADLLHLLLLLQALVGSVQLAHGQPDREAGAHDAAEGGDDEREHDGHQEGGVAEPGELPIDARVVPIRRHSHQPLVVEVGGDVADGLLRELADVEVGSAHRARGLDRRLPRDRVRAPFVLDLRPVVVHQGARELLLVFGEVDARGVVGEVVVGPRGLAGVHVPQWVNARGQLVRPIGRVDIKVLAVAGRRVAHAVPLHKAIVPPDDAPLAPVVAQDARGLVFEEFPTLDGFCGVRVRIVGRGVVEGRAGRGIQEQGLVLERRAPHVLDNERPLKYQLRGGDQVVVHRLEGVELATHAQTEGGGVLGLPVRQVARPVYVLHRPVVYITVPWGLAGVDVEQVRA